jgi:hypothetical protein
MSGLSATTARLEDVRKFSFDSDETATDSSYNEEMTLKKNSSLASNPSFWGKEFSTRWSVPLIHSNYDNMSATHPPGSPAKLYKV